MTRRSIKWVFIFLVTSACVDPIFFEVPPPADIIVIDGSITTDGGPTIVKIQRAVKLDADTLHRSPLSGLKIKLHDYGIGVEDFTEEKPGEYRTEGLLRGIVGHTYHITAEMPDGTLFESDPETMQPAGQIVAITHQYEPRTTVKPWAVLRLDAFNVFVDGNIPVRSENDQVYVRWRFTGTYKAATNPELHKTHSQGEFYYLTPYACSGYVVEPALGGGILTKREECTCCTCWVKDPETKPHLSDTESVSGGQFRNIKVADVPITPMTFYDKYKVEVEQMTITKNAFDFFKLIRTQKDAATNIFQPPSGRLIGNIHSSNSDQQVVGMFWAAAVTRKSVYIKKSDVPYELQRQVIVVPCNDYFAKSTVVKPTDWDE